MGQLEKYGLYVLCLVIFLILGVTIWGEGSPAGKRAPGSPGADLAAGSPAGPAAERRAGPVGTPSFEALLRPQQPEAARNTAPPANAPGGQPQAGGEAKPAEQPKASEPPKPEVAAARPAHKVQSGDSFESIAKQHFGSVVLRLEIARLNPRAEPTKLKPGQELLLPTRAEADAILQRAGKPAPRDAAAPGAGGKPAPAEPGTYTVARGDTFEGIAIRQLGSRKRVDEIRNLNPGLDPTNLRIGEKIKLPKK